MLQFCSLRLYLGIESISCCLSRQMARMDMDGNMKKSAKTLGQLLPDEVCLISSSKHYRSIFCLGKGTIKVMTSA